MVSIDYLFEELLRLRESNTEDTADFELYSHDDVCEKVDAIARTLGDYFLKYEAISYIVQGPRDQGVDVLLKVTPDDEPQKFIGIQVKSFGELNDKKNDVSKQLKAGFHDARYHYDRGLVRYYILLCGDAEKNAKRMSAITNEFAKEKSVRVIGPRHILNFLRLTDATIAAVVDTFLREEDVVRQQAKREVVEYSKSELYFLLVCISHVLENGSDKIEESFLFNDVMCQVNEQFSAHVFDEVFHNLSESVLEIHAQEQSIRLRIESFPAVRALYYDNQVRYGTMGQDLITNLFEYLILSV